MIPAILGAATTVLPKLFDLVQSFFPNSEDKVKAAQLQIGIQQLLLEHDTKIVAAAAENVKAEIQSSNWLASSWRPLLMLFFAVLIGARMFGYTAPGVTEPEYLELWSLMKLGIGGYVMGRSAEKVLPDVLKAFKK